MAVQRALVAVGVERGSHRRRSPLHASAGAFEQGSAGPGQTGDRGWAAAAIPRAHQTLGAVRVGGVAPVPYVPGLLALGQGPLRAMAIEALRSPLDVFLIDATGRDHPRRAGMALHLDAALGVPTVAVSHRALVAAGGPPGTQRFARSPRLLDETLAAGCVSAWDPWGLRTLEVRMEHGTAPVAGAVSA